MSCHIPWAGRRGHGSCAPVRTDLVVRRLAAARGCRDRPQPGSCPWRPAGGVGTFPGQERALRDWGVDMGAVDTVEAEVRELVRRRGIDPVVDRAAMRRLVDEAVAEYDDRSLTSSLPPLTDSRQAAKAVYDAVAGYGPLQRHLDDPQVEEIWINERLSAGSDVAPQLGSFPAITFRSTARTLVRRSGSARRPPASHWRLVRLLVALLLGLAGQAHLELVYSLGERGQLFAEDRRRRQLLVG